MKESHKKVLKGIAKVAGLSNEQMQQVHKGVATDIMPPLRAIIVKFFGENVDRRIERGVLSLVTLSQAMEALPHMLPPHMKDFAVESIMGAVSGITTAQMTEEQLHVYEKMADCAIECVAWLNTGRAEAVAAIRGEQHPFDKLETET